MLKYIKSYNITKSYTFSQYIEPVRLIIFKLSLKNNTTFLVFRKCIKYV